MFHNHFNRLDLLADMSNPWPKGKSGNPLGRRSEKPFADALKMELAAAGEDQKKLRKIARNLINLAADDKGELPAILAIADRLDGRPAQDSHLTVEKRDATDWSLAELVAILRDEEGSTAAGEERSAAESGRSEKLN
jgi:hypothetical protein